MARVVSYLWSVFLFHFLLICMLPLMHNTTKDQCFSFPMICLLLIVSFYLICLLLNVSFPLVIFSSGIIWCYSLVVCFGGILWWTRFLWSEPLPLIQASSDPRCSLWFLDFLLSYFLHTQLNYYCINCYYKNFLLSSQ